MTKIYNKTESKSCLSVHNSGISSVKLYIYLIITLFFKKSSILITKTISA